MKKFTFLLFLTTIFCYDFSFAQNHKEHEPKLIAVSAYISIGYSTQNNQKLNTRLITFGLPDLDNTGTLIGFGGNVFFKRWAFGGEGNIETGNRKIVQSLESHLNSGSALVYTGYIIQKSRQLLIYPTLGLGIGGTGLKLKSDRNMNTSGSSSSMHIDSHLTSAYLLTKLTINTDFFMRNGHTNGGFILGLSLSYNYSLLTSNWSENNDAEAFRGLENQNPSVNGIRFKIKLGWGIKRP